ncbi:hypothetical protein [Streptomyces sp. CBMA29]|nr:hypothetical protein [Streptomyces sp. CBMA29]
MPARLDPPQLVALGAGRAFTFAPAIGRVLAGLAPDWRWTGARR